MTPETTNDYQTWATQQTFPGDITIQQRHVTRHFSIQSATGHIEADLSDYAIFSTGHITVHLNHEAECRFHELGDSVTLCFLLHGHIKFEFPALGIAKEVKPGQQGIYYIVEADGHLELEPEDGIIQLFYINVSKTYYAMLLGEYSDIQRAFIQQISLGNADAYNDLGFIPITVPMKWLLNTVQQSTRTGLLKRLFLKAKVLELLMLQIEQYDFLSDAHAPQPTKANDQLAITEAKKILEKNIYNPPTIRNLSRLVGLNEFSLKKGFKETYNTTIYGFVNNLKMQQAKQWILDGEKSIHEIADLSGYKNPQHFTVAFKKYFGQLPSKIKA
jgi:AraC-like DNA-binding protein